MCSLTYSNIIFFPVHACELNLIILSEVFITKTGIYVCVCYNIFLHTKIQKHNAPFTFQDIFAFLTWMTHILTDRICYLFFCFFFLLCNNDPVKYFCLSDNTVLLCTVSEPSSLSLSHTSKWFSKVMCIYCGYLRTLFAVCVCDLFYSLIIARSYAVQYCTSTIQKVSIGDQAVLAVMKKFHGDFSLGVMRVKHLEMYRLVFPS